MTTSHDRPPPGPAELLSTKLAAPPLRGPLVSRQALLRRLDESLAFKLTLISAPAGFGKTTLVAEWVDRLKGWKVERLNGQSSNPRTSRSSTLKPSNFQSPIGVSWVSLDGGDNDPARFWRYVLTASLASGAGAARTALDLLERSADPSYETLLTLFINQATRLESKAVLVLDDYHTITDRRVHETLAFFLEHLPPSLHVALITRSDPPLPLGRMRARHELSELRAEDLRFSGDETRAFLEQSIPFDLPGELAARLAQRTEGWAAGLRLAALALQRHERQGEIRQFLETFTGSLRPIQEYLVEEVFAAQPPAIQQFLLKTSFLNRLSGPLCDAVLGSRERGVESSELGVENSGPKAESRNDSLLSTLDSQFILDYLERANLFLVPLDSAGQWYRFHALFAEALQQTARQRLGEAQIGEVHRRASLWLEAHGLLPEAVEAALAGDDPSRAADLIARIIAPRLAMNEYATLRRWMEQLPEEVLRAHPAICMTFAVAILFTSVRSAPETRARLQIPLEIAEAHWQREGNRSRLGEVLAFRALVTWLQRDLPRSFHLAWQALDLLPEGEVQWRGISLVLVGSEALYAGRMNAARRILGEALAFLEAAENIFGVLDSILLLGDVCYQQGELAQAARHYQQVLARLVDTPIEANQILIRRGRALQGLAALALEQNDLKVAEKYAAEAVAIGRQVPEEILLEYGPLVLARVRQAQGEFQAAQELLGELAARTRFAALQREVRLQQARLALALGDLSAAQRWAERSAQPGGEADFMGFHQEQEALFAARLQIAQGRPGEALDTLAAWLGEAKAQGRTRSEMEIAALMALAHATQGDPPRARQALARALELAQSEGYRRVFLNEGEPLKLILEDCKLNLEEGDREPLRSFIDRLLIAFPEKNIGPGDRDPSKKQPSSTGNLLDPLSAQERRVLRLIGAGLTNPEIARELVVSLNTVKTHVKSIYRKLQVSNRREARQAARRLE